MLSHAAFKILNQKMKLAGLDVADGVPKRVASKVQSDMPVHTH